MYCRNEKHFMLAVALLSFAASNAHAWLRQIASPTTAPAVQSDSARGNEPVLREASGEIRNIDLIVGQSRILETAWPVKRVSVTDPNIADVDLSSPSRLQLQGKSVGVSEVTIWSERGDSWQARLDVKADVGRIQHQLRKLFSNRSLEVAQIDDVVVIKGTLARSEDAAQLRAFLKMTDLRYLDLTNIAGLQQVQLQVKVAEVSRTAIRLLGINTFYGGEQWFGGVQIGSSAGPFVPMNVGVPSGTPVPGTVFQALSDIAVPPTATLFAGFPSSDLQFFLQALAENQYLRILAEPTLVARSGQEAHFLAGGEFPIPIAQLGGGGTTQISIEYKEFGVRLRFTPTVLGNGMIQLKVQPEISELSDVGAVSVLGTRVPSVLSRRVETTLDLQSGQTFAIAGLINQSDSATTSRVPGLGEIPILGSMFRSVRYSRNNTEMVVLVTASLVEPSSSDLNPLLPGEFHQEPSDWELYLEGRIEGRPKARVAPACKEKLEQMGLDRLRGPGAWASYDQTPNTLAGQSSGAR